MCTPVSGCESLRELAASLSTSAWPRAPWSAAMKWCRSRVRSEHAAGLDLVLVLVLVLAGAEGTEQQAQVIHAPGADAPQALGDGRAQSRMARSIGSSSREKVSAPARHFS